MTQPSTSPDTARFELRDDREQIAEAERALLEAVEKRGYPEPSRFALRLALEEAIVNAFRHGHCDLPAECSVTVEWRVEASRTEITVCDQGPGFDTDCVPDPTLEENLDSPSGRGIMLMRAYMTEVRFNDRGNCVTMVYDRDRAATG